MPPEKERKLAAEGPRAKRGREALEDEEDEDDHLEEGSGSEDDEEIEDTPPSKEAVVERLLLEAAIVQRTVVEKEKSEAGLKKLREWFAAIHKSDGEDLATRAINPALESKLGSLEADDIQALESEAECVHTLLWSLGLIPALHPLDVDVKTADVLSLCSVGSVDAAKIIGAKSTLKPIDDIKSLIRWIDAIRFRTELEHLSRANPEQMKELMKQEKASSPDELKKRCVAQAVEVGDVKKEDIKDGDLSVGSTPMGKMESEKVLNVLRNVNERHLTLEFLTTGIWMADLNEINDDDDEEGSADEDSEEGEEEEASDEDNA